MRTLLATAPPYDLARTLTSGQCFRWTATTGGWRGIFDGAVATVTQDAGSLRVTWEGGRGADEAGAARALRAHLGVDEPLAEIEAALAGEGVLRRLLPRTSGVALMRQDPWECLVSFVISSFNNIPKIALSIGRLASSFGEHIGGNGALDAFRFPRPEDLAGADPATLRACALGYRAGYVRDLARLAARGAVDLQAISRLPYEEARRALLDLPGIGEKVAECVLLFGLGHREAFPVDVWVQRAVERWYFHGRRVTPRSIRAWARERFGLLAGYAQQHLFLGARMMGRRWPRAAGGDQR